MRACRRPGPAAAHAAVADFVSWYARDRRILLSRVDSPPTDGLMLISLSLSTISSGCLSVPEVVERLHRQARADGRVADADRDPLAPRRIGCAAQVAGRGQSDPDADAGAGVAAVEDVVVALAAPREAADAVDLAQRLESVPPAGEELVRVGLVAGVPHDPVARRVHDPVQRECDLDGAKRAGEVAARLA